MNTRTAAGTLHNISAKTRTPGSVLRDNLFHHLLFSGEMFFEDITVQCYPSGVWCLAKRGITLEGMAIVNHDYMGVSPLFAVPDSVQTENISRIMSCTRNLFFSHRDFSPVHEGV